MLAPGALVHGRYKIERQVEEGGMSVVYAAWDKSLGARVAIKEMKGAYTDNAEKMRVTEQFRLEATMLANLHHPGLPHVSNSFDEGDTSYLVMDLIEGDSLSRMLNRLGVTPPEGLVLMWAYEICEVLEYLHTRKPPIIFRDLKPSNVMITTDGHVKVIDFGISKIFDHTVQGATRTAIRGAGTPGYQPPEQYGASSSRRTDPRSDVYSLGATLYSVMTFVVPPEATDRWMNKVPVVPVTQLCDTCSIELATMIEKMMQLDPDERYTSAREVMRELQTLMGGVPPREAVELPAGMMKAPLDTAALDTPEAIPDVAPPRLPPASEAPGDDGPHTQLPLGYQPTQRAVGDSFVAVVAPETRVVAVPAPAAPRPLGAMGAVVGALVLLGVGVFWLHPPALFPTAAASPTAVPSHSGSPDGVAVVVPTGGPVPIGTPHPTAEFHILVQPAGTDLYLNGSPHLKLPADGYDVMIRPPVQIKLRRAGYVPIDTDIKDLPPGGRKVYSMVQTGNIQVASPTAHHGVLEPAKQHVASFGVDVQVKREDAPALPHTFKDLPPGTYKVDLSAPGYRDKTVTVAVTPGGTTKVADSLEPVPVVHNVPPPPCPHPYVRPAYTPHTPPQPPPPTGEH